MTEQTSSSIAVGPPPRPGTITLVRHGEPALSRKIKLNGDEYREWWGRYELGGIKDGQTAPAVLQETARRADVIFVSERRRAIESAKLAIGDKPFTVDGVFIEAPLPPPPLPSFIRLGPKIWGFIARFCWWYFRYGDGSETRTQAEARASLAADMLEAPVLSGQNVLLVAHGFFNTMLAIELKKRGWRHATEGGYRYWNTRTFTRE